MVGIESLISALFGSIPAFSRITLFLFVLLLTRCSRESQSPQPENIYIPIELGLFSEFDVARTNYSITSLPETKHLKTKEIISDSSRNVRNQVVYKIDYLSHGNSGEWTLDSSSGLWQTLDKIMIQENGQSIVRMLFPLSEKLTWDVNQYNIKDMQRARVERLGLPYLINNHQFPNTVTIIRQDDSTLLSKNKYIEVYAQNVGLIRRERVHLQYCNTPDCWGKGIIQSGWTEVSTIKNYGK